MHKLMEHIEREIHEIAEKGFSPTNIDNAMKFVDMYKDLKYVEYMGFTEGAYHEVKEEMMPGKARTMERREGSRFDRNINELYDKYLWCKKEYARDGSEVHRQKVTESLERLMSEICDLLFDINRDADFKAERDVVLKYKKSMEQIS